MDEEDLSKYLKEGVDLKGIIFPPSLFYTDPKIDLVKRNITFILRNLVLFEWTKSAIFYLDIGS